VDTNVFSEILRLKIIKVLADEHGLQNSAVDQYVLQYGTGTVPRKQERKQYSYLLQTANFPYLPLVCKHSFLQALLLTTAKYSAKASSENKPIKRTSTKATQHRQAARTSSGHAACTCSMDKA
jgi:hypothetical protein